MPMAALLLDENLPRSTADALARAGHDVLHIAQAEAAAEDRRVLALARASGRVLVTFDADFGDLVYRRGEPVPPSILYLRLHPIDGAVAAALVLQALDEPVQGQFVVCTREGLRRRALPPQP
jgi:predicted nuclease of predicted toxin-antitoxin system